VLNYREAKMAKYKIRRIADKKTVIAQAGINEMTDIISTKDPFGSLNPFIGKAIDPEAIVRGTAGLDYVPGRESVNPEYGMFHGAPGAGMPIEFKMTPDEMDYLNKHPKEKLEYEQKKLERILKDTQKSQLNQVIPKLESFYAIYRSSPSGLSLGKLKEEARMIRQLSPMDKSFLMTKPYWNLIKDVVK
jgi:hypothetical protein